MQWKECLFAFAFALILAWVVEVATQGTVFYTFPVFAVSWIFLYYWFRKTKKVPI